MDRERLKKEYLRLLDKVSPDKDSNKIILEKLKELDTETTLTKDKIRELDKLLESGELETGKTPEQPIIEPSPQGKTAREKVTEAESILSEKVNKDKHINNWNEKLETIESEIQDLKRVSGKRRTETEKKKLTLLENQKKQLQQKIDKRTTNLQSGKKIGVQVGKLEKTEKKGLEN